MTTQAQAPTEAREYLEGHWYWADLHTPDIDGSMVFYGQLFGWEAQDFPVGNGLYRMAMLDGQPVAAMNEQRREQREAGVPPHWLNYVTTTDVDAAATRSVEFGGTLASPPFDVVDAGRMAVVVDPTGGTFALWQAARRPGTGIVGCTGTLCWTELQSTDADAALAFYQGLFGYDVTTQDMGGGHLYHVLSTTGRQACGVMAQTPDLAGMPSAWSTYFYADDVDATTERARDLGATVLVEPRDITDGRRFSVVLDPQGAVFCLFSDASR